jgi:hypothetical protein
MTDRYDDWDDSIAQDRQGGKKSSGKRWAFFHKLTDTPVRVHFSHPESPYIHPSTGSQLPYRVGARHFIPYGGKRGNGQMIECGYPLGLPCVVCAYENPGAYELQNIQKQSIDEKGAQLYVAVSGWVEEEFHLVDVQNRENPAESHKERQRCLIRGCQDCQDGWPKVFGTRFYTEMSVAQWDNVIADLNRSIKNSFCRCGGKIYVPSFSCPNCQVIMEDVALTCEHCHATNVQIDPESDTAVCMSCQSRWSAVYTTYVDLTKRMHGRSVCKNCHKEVKPVPNRWCSTPNCQIDPYDVFDCQLVLRMTGQKKDRKLVVDSCSIQEPDPMLFDPAWQGGDAKAGQVVENHRKPMDLNYLLKPLSSAEQAKLLNLPDPFMAMGRAAGAAAYARYTRDSGTPEPGAAE